MLVRSGLWSETDKQQSIDLHPSSFFNYLLVCPSQILKFTQKQNLKSELIHVHLGTLVTV